MASTGAMTMDLSADRRLTTTRVRPRRRDYSVRRAQLEETLQNEVSGRYSNQVRYSRALTDSHENKSNRKLLALGHQRCERNNAIPLGVHGVFVGLLKWYKGRHGIKVPSTT